MQNLHIVLLAAGKGKRMVSDLPKVLHPVLFQPMLHHVLDVAFSLPSARVCAVVGHGASKVREACTRYPSLVYAEQKEQRGTAHAVSSAREFFDKAEGTVLILSGDVILLRRETLTALIKAHQDSRSACTLVSAKLSQPKGYGRILREQGRVVAIREEVDCSDLERRIEEVNAGVYCFEAAALREALTSIRDVNQQHEFYLTDAIAYLNAKHQRVDGFLLDDPQEMLGINDRMALAQVESVLRDRINHRWMRDGVTIHAPQTVYIDARTQLASDVEIEPGAIVIDSRIGARTRVEANVRIESCEIGSDCVIKQGSYLTQSAIGMAVAVGPYAHLRPGNTLGNEVKIGNFVELKKTKMGNNSKASHLSYLGDAELGERVNIGCGFITCNFDGGPKKHKTVIEDDVFVGSDSQAVAPVTIGKGAYVASGTTVTLDVPGDALAVSRVKQSNKLGYASRLRRKASKE